METQLSKDQMVAKVIELETKVSIEYSNHMSFCDIPFTPSISEIDIDQEIKNNGFNVQEIRGIVDSLS